MAHENILDQYHTEQPQAQTATSPLTKVDAHMAIYQRTEYEAIK